jgi:hypothetical protein
MIIRTNDIDDADKLIIVVVIDCGYIIIRRE